MTLWHHPHHADLDEGPWWSPLLAVIAACGLLVAAAVAASLVAPWS